MGKRFQAVHCDTASDGTTKVRRYAVDLQTFNAETTAEKTYEPEELDLDVVWDWCEGHGFDPTFDDRDVQRDLGIQAMQARFLHRSLPERIDLVKLSNGTIRVTHLERRGARDVPSGTPFDLEGHDLSALHRWLSWLGYQTFYWQTGARAFRGTPWPVRTRRQIVEKRRRLERIARQKMKANPGKWHDEETLLRMDLAYAG